MNDFKKQIVSWLDINDSSDISLNLFENRDIFQDELIKITQKFLSSSFLTEDDSYILSAIIGEIGSNSFDHNIGNWKRERGIIFGYIFKKNYLKIVLADYGQGVLTTLKKVRPNLKNDKDALKVAFTEVISGRAPESRGNGLKFVRQSIKKEGLHLKFISGKAQVDINNLMKFKKNNKKFNGCLAIIKVNLIDNSKKYEKN